MEKATGNNFTIRRLHTIRFRDLCKQLSALPNLLSVSRILFLPVVVFFIIKRLDTAAVISMAVIWITDFIDGYIAKKFRIKTDLGLILDPVADKITCAVVFFTLVLFRDFPTWVLIIIIARDIIILTAAYYLLKRGHLAQSNKFGRWTTVLLATIILLYLLHFYKWAYMLSYVIIVFVVITLITYSILFLRTIKEIPRNTP